MSVVAVLESEIAADEVSLRRKKDAVALLRERMAPTTIELILGDEPDTSIGRALRVLGSFQGPMHLNQEIIPEIERLGWELPKATSLYSALVKHKRVVKTGAGVFCLKEFAGDDSEE